jgi:hypothetical protein
VGQAWSIADDILAQQLRAWLVSLYPLQPWFVDLFTNHYEPQPGDTMAPYVLPTWAGYAQVQILASGWGAVTLTDHVASSTQSQSCVYPLPTGLPAQVVYGYVVSDYYGNFVYAESWTAPVTVPAGAGITIVPVLRTGIGCVPDPPLVRRRGRPRKRPVVDLDDDDDDEE